MPNLKKNKNHNRALFLDRDGVINIDKHYVYKISDFEFIDGIFELIRQAKAMHYLVIIITNQSGIGRGLYDKEDFYKLNSWMKKEIEKNGGYIDDIYYSSTHPVHGKGAYKVESYDRKPNPGLLLQAEKDHLINLKKSIFLGDKISDMEAGIAGKVGRNFLMTLNSDYLDLKEGKFQIISSFQEIYKHL